MAVDFPLVRIRYDSAPGLFLLCIQIALKYTPPWFMHWIAPAEKDTDNAALERRLWDAADQFRANSGLKSQEYSAPVLGLIFLRFAEVRFAAQRARLEKASANNGKGN